MSAAVVIAFLFGLAGRDVGLVDEAVVEEKVVKAVAFLLCGAPPQRLCKAPHDSGVCWKQFMMLLEEVLVCGGVSPARPGSTKGFASV